ncbi:hypothetical protein HK104_001023, partial [Borealophlyctis nickersoniae]
MCTIRSLLRKAAYLRHTFLLSDAQRHSIRGYTLLIRDIPRRLRDPEKLRILFNRIQPGTVHAVVVLKQSRTLQTLYERRRAAMRRLEADIVTYLGNIARERGKKRVATEEQGRPWNVVPESGERVKADEERRKAADLNQADAAEKMRENLGERPIEDQSQRICGDLHGSAPGSNVERADAAEKTDKNFGGTTLEDQSQRTFAELPGSTPGLIADDGRVDETPLEMAGSSSATVNQQTEPTFIIDMQDMDDIAREDDEQGKQKGKRLKSGMTLASLNRDVTLHELQRDILIAMAELDSPKTAARAADPCLPSSGNPSHPALLALPSFLTLDTPTPLRPFRRTYHLFGAAYDSISSSLRELRYCNLRMDSKRASLASSTTHTQGAAFIIFNDLFSPHVAALATVHGTPGVMGEKWPGVDPDDVIWENLSIPYAQRTVRWIVATGVTIALTMTWGIISTFIASIANLDKLTRMAPFLRFFNNASPAFKGIIQGVLPTVATLIVFSLIPIVMRLLSHFAGLPTQTSIERRLLHFYFAFLVVNVLLVITISGSILSSIRNILNNPSSIVPLLATSIPSVSNFFVNYIMLLALGGPSGELLQLAQLILQPLFLKLFGKTPRTIRENSKPTLFLPGTVMAQHAFVAVVGVTYCTIAPLVLVFVVVYFGMYAVAYGYQMQYVYTHLPETGGMYMYTATTQLFAGLYIHQITLLGLFYLKQAMAQGTIMLIGLACTAIFHWQANAYGPLMSSVPAKAVVDIETRSTAQSTTSLDASSTRDTNVGGKSERDSLATAGYRWLEQVATRHRRKAGSSHHVSGAGGEVSVAAPTPTTQREEGGVKSAQ